MNSKLDEIKARWRLRLEHPPKRNHSWTRWTREINIPYSAFEPTCKKCGLPKATVAGGDCTVLSDIGSHVEDVRWLIARVEKLESYVIGEIPS